MDSFEFNKIAGAILATALGVMALSIVSEIIFQPAEADQPGYVVAGVDPTDDAHGGAEPGGGGDDDDEEADVEPIAVRLQTADVADGEDDAGKCKSCHTFAEGDTRKTPGPNLWGIVGALVGHQEDFGYSDAVVERHEAGEIWTFENLDEWLKNRKAFIPGTRMTFAGLKRPEERADLIAYLRTLSNDPVPLPAVTAEAPAEAPPAEHPVEAAPAVDAHAPPPATEPVPATPPELAPTMAPPAEPTAPAPGPTPAVPPPPAEPPTP